MHLASLPKSNEALGKDNDSAMPVAIAGIKLHDGGLF